VAERAATPLVPGYRRKAVRAIGSLFSPLLPDDYLELINPLWSTRELWGRIERIEPETADAATVSIRPGARWPGHRPGQYLRIGVLIDGVNHWRAYSLTSDPDRDDGCVAITPKLVESGTVSPFLLSEARPGDVLRLGGVEGTFVLPDPAPEKLLFISAGSGVTPIISMLSDLHRRKAIGDVVHLHSSRDADGVIFGERLREIAAASDGFDLRLRLTGSEGRLAPASLDAACPDWRERRTFLSGPPQMLEAFSRHWEEEGDADLLELERFQPTLVGTPGGGEGGAISFLESEVRSECDGATPILVAGEEAGVGMPHGCRMGVCHTCVGELRSGRLRDLRSGEIHGRAGETFRTCVNAPEGPIEILF
jgi:ferredoxin-NADP reductase